MQNKIGLLAGIALLQLLLIALFWFGGDDGTPQNAQLLSFDALVQRNNAPGHIVVFGIGVTRRIHHSFESVLVRMHTNGFRKITIAIGVIGNQFTHQRQNSLPCSLR